MKIKRFFAPDIRQAIKLVRDELGPEAVILSNRQVKGGVEIVSAIDYDEELLQQFTPDVPSHSRSQAASVSSTLASARTPAPEKSARSTPTESPPQRKATSRVEKPSNSPKLPANSTQTAEPASSVLVWSQEPTLVEMRREIESLRGLLENQLTGLAWSEMHRRFPLKAQLLQRLSKLGLSGDLCQHLADKIRNSRDMDALWREALALLVTKIPIAHEDMLNHGGTIAFVGPTGVGKTTTIAKLAARFALRHGSRHVGLITLDNYRVGAHEQLRAYGRILDIPVRVAAGVVELQRYVEDMAERRLVLIDTAGVSHRDPRMNEQLTLLKSGGKDIQTYLVLAATTRLSALEDITQSYQQSPIHGCILTKIDETTSLGSSLSAVVKYGLPVAFFSDGQKVPEDLHQARADALVERAVAIMKSSDAFLNDELLTYKNDGELMDARV